MKKQIFKSKSFLGMVALFALALSPTVAAAACHVVTPGGSGANTGADWNNALPGSALSGTSLVRGDSYYLADGTYPAPAFQQPVSGSLVITVKKAIGSDHCTDTGWNLSSMGSAAASFGFSGNAIVSFETSHWVFSGNGRTSSNSGYGFVLDYHISDCNASQCFYVRNFPLFTSNLTDITVQYIQEIGHGSLTNTHYDEGFYFFGGSSLRFTYNNIFNSSGTPFEGGGNSTVLIDHNLVDTTYYTSTNHSGGIQDQGTSNLVISNNVWKDIEGTSVITDLCRSNCGQTANNWQIFGNAFYNSTSPSNSPFNGDGIVACINGELCTNWTIYNNDTVNFTNNSAGIICSPCVSGSSFSIKNNIWYKNSANLTFPAGSGITVTTDYNSFIANSFTNGFTSAGGHDLTTSTDSGPFVNWQNGDFHLRIENANWTGWLALPSPFNMDPDQNPRATDRGAYQFVTQSSSAVVPPTLLSPNIQ